MGTSIQKVCTTTNPNGERCTQKIILEKEGSEWCITHHPNASEWRSKGGHSKSTINRALASTPEELQALIPMLLKGMEETYTGAMRERTLHALAHGADAVIRAYAQLHDIHEEKEAIDETRALALEAIQATQRRN